MTLQADLRALADAIALPDSDLHKRIESALHTAVKLGMESCKRYHVDKAVNIRKSSDAHSLSYIFAHQHEIDAAWIAQLLRELTDE